MQQWGVLVVVAAVTVLVVLVRAMKAFEKVAPNARFRAEFKVGKHSAASLEISPVRPDRQQLPASPVD
ncbi:hypothetical protein, partial [Nonomuraea recticatena]|uniref:hypothetical protein n=1 Tax=Nonomuraea recticatena TaxID=46178 RepID=UPI0031F91785